MKSQENSLLFLHPNFSHLKTDKNHAKIVRYERFSDGWPRIFLEEKHSLEGKEVTYIGDFLSLESFFPQMAFLDALLRYHISRLDVFIPFLAVASMERDTPSGEIGIASLFCRIFGVLGERLPGNLHIHLYDIHDEREVFYFPPNVRIHHHTTTGNFIELLEKKGEKPIILFPDSGAKKAFSRFFRDYETVTCSKVRKSPTTIEMHFEGGSIQGKSVIIIDDHIRSGGTILEAARAVRDRGAISVGAYVPHAVFSLGVPENFLKSIDSFYTTDTIPENYERFSGKNHGEIIAFFPHES